MTETITLKTYEPTPRQCLAHQNKALVTLYGGAKGGGKSRFLCEEANVLCLEFPGNKIWMGRKQASDFRDTTLETFRQFIDSRLYTINEQKHTINYRNGSRILYGGFDRTEDVNKFNSAEYGAVLIDQAEEISQKEYSMSRGSIYRYKLPDGRMPRPRMLLTANPAQCWLKEYFITHPEPDTAYIQALPSDNPHLHPSYITNLQLTYKFRPQLLQAYLYGSWDILEGSDVLILSAWIEKCVKKTLVNVGKDRNIIVTDCSRMGDDETVLYHIVNYEIKDELIFGKQLTDITCQRIAQFYHTHEAEYVALDNDNIGAGIGDNLQALKIPIKRYTMSGKADQPDRYLNKRAEIFWTVADMFAKHEVSIPNDTDLISQLNSYTYKFASGNRIQVGDKEEIKKKLGRSPDRSDACLIGMYTCKEAVGKVNKDSRFARYQNNYSNSAMAG